MVHEKGLYDLNDPRCAPRTDWHQLHFQPPAAAYSGRLPSVALRAGPAVTPRRTVRVDLARRDLSGKIARPAVHKAEFSRASAAMQEITNWLTKLGLPEYAGAFAENGIDVSVLPHLTDQDLPAAQ
jgi:SAM domain (Sterile alpha motif)